MRINFGVFNDKEEAMHILSGFLRVIRFPYSFANIHFHILIFGIFRKKQKVSLSDQGAYA